MKNYLWIITGIFFIGSLQPVISQSRYEVNEAEEEDPYGETTIGYQKTFTGLKETRLIWTAKGCYAGDYDPIKQTLLWEKIFPPPNSDALSLTDDIASGYLQPDHSVIILTKTGKIFKCSLDGDMEEVFILLTQDPNEVFETIKSGRLWTSLDNIPNNAGEINAHQIRSVRSAENRSMVFYARSSSRFFISRDTLKTWLPDTSGLNGTPPKSFDIDSSQYVYIAHADGVFRQHRDSMTWNKLSAFPGTNPTLIFVDLQQRILVSSTTSRKTYISTDGGAGWSIDTTGFNNEYPVSFGDDIFGNIYAITGKFGSPSKIFRSVGGTEPWTRIDGPLMDLIPDIANYDGYYNPAFRAIGGDSILVVGTVFGVFSSSDQGTTWQECNDGIRSKKTYGFLKTPSGRTISNTNPGIFCRDAGDTAWIKTYPQTGSNCYTSNRSSTLFSDREGNIYSIGPRLNSTSGTNPPMPIRSSNEGTTWLPDTAGFGSVGTGYNMQYFVDETGTQYLASYSMPAHMITKRPGQPWSVDSLGYANGFANRQPVTFASDMRGNIYIGTVGSNAGLLLTRPISGDIWTPDTTGLGGEVVYAMTSDKLGNFYVSGFNMGMMKKNGTTWQQVSIPAGVSGCAAFGFSVDSSNTLYAVFGDMFNWRGVYSTADRGSTWTYVGFDQVGIRLLVSYGDTTYAITTVNGVYKLVHSNETDITLQKVTPNSFSLEQNYPNPFNPTTTINFSLPKSAFVTVNIYNSLGQKVATVMSKQMNAGTHTTEWNASGFASGVYYCQLEADRVVKTKKIVLLR
jgi:hypothetical protein